MRRAPQLGIAALLLQNLTLAVLKARSSGLDAARSAPSRA